MQINFGELITESKQSVVIVQTFNKPIKIEVLNYVGYILAESIDVVFKVEVYVIWVVFQSRKVIFGGVVEISGLSYL